MLHTRSGYLSSCVSLSFSGMGLRGDVACHIQSSCSTVPQVITAKANGTCTSGPVGGSTDVVFTSVLTLPIYEQNND